MKLTGPYARGAAGYALERQKLTAADDLTIIHPLFTLQLAKRIVADEEKPVSVPAPAAPTAEAVPAGEAADGKGLEGEKGGDKVGQATAKSSDRQPSSVKEEGTSGLLDSRSLLSAEQPERRAGEAAGGNVGGSGTSTDTAAPAAATAAAAAPATAAAPAVTTTRDSGTRAAAAAAVKEEELHEAGESTVRDASRATASADGTGAGKAGVPLGDRAAVGDASTSRQSEEEGLKRKEAGDGSAREGSIKKVKVKVKMQSLNP